LNGCMVQVTLKILLLRIGLDYGGVLEEEVGVGGEGYLFGKKKDFWSTTLHCWLM